MRGPIAIASPGALLGHPAEVLHLGQACRAGKPAAASARPAPGRTPPPGQPRPPARSRPDSAGTAGPARRPNGDAPQPPPAATGRSGRGFAAIAPQRAPSPAGAGPGWRSGRCWSPRTRRCSRWASLDQRIVAGRVERVAVVPQLHQHPIAARTRSSTSRRQLTPRRSRPVGDQRGGNRPLAAPREHPAVAADRVGDVAERELRRPLLAREMSGCSTPARAGRSRRGPRRARADGSRTDRRACESGTMPVSTWRSVSASDRATRPSCAASVISVPNTVGRPTASGRLPAKRTTP